MNLRPDAERVYGRSAADAVSVIQLHPSAPLRVRLAPTPEEAPLHGGYHAFARAPVEGGADAAARRLAGPGPLHPAGGWGTPPFTPHRREVQAFVAHSPAGAEAPEGELHAPADALARWRRGELLFDTPTLLCLRALAGLAPALPDLGAIAAAVGDALAEADRALPRREDGAPLAHLPHEVRPGVRLIPLRSPTLPPATHTNAIVVGDGELFVVDPASPWASERQRLDDALEALTAQGARLKAVLLTHHHVDHVSGAAHLAERWGAPIWAHGVTADLLGSLPVARRLSDGEVIHAHGSRAFSLRCIHTPGHAPGHLCFFEEASGVLIAGDMVAGWGTIAVAPPEGDMAAYLHHLASLGELGARVVLPAHGPALADGRRVFEAFRAHRLRREDALVALLAEGLLTPAELTSRAYPDIPRWVRPAAEGSVLAHVLKLEAEGRLCARLDGRLALTGGADPP